MRWGIVPPWTPAEQVARFDGRTINARSETAAEKPTFKGPLAFRRCLVPATSYYEWETREWVESVAPPDAQLGLFGSESGAPPRGRTRKRTLKIPHRIWSGDGSLLALAGIYEVWGQGTPNALPTVSLFTRPANAFTARIHDRMPILLSSEDQVRWLDPTIRGIAPSSTLLARLAAGEPPELREAIASQRVNSPEQDDPSLWVADQESSSSS
jgi:putative SOS response-associated peptidase YedK